MTVKSLLITIDGVEIVSADEQGNVDYAKDYTGSKVVKALAMAGVELGGVVHVIVNTTPEPAKPAEPAEPAKPKPVSLNEARDEVERLWSRGVFGDTHPAKKFLDAVQAMQGMLGTYHDPEKAEDANRPALAKEIEQALMSLDALSAQAPAGEARNALNAYIGAARKEFTNPGKHEGAPNLTKGDMTDVEKGDITG